MVSQHQSIWTQCRGRKGGGRFQNQSWPDDTCFDACLLPSETGQVSGHSDHKHKYEWPYFCWHECQPNMNTTPDSSESRTATNRHSGSGSWWSSSSTSPVTVYRFRWTENSSVCGQKTNSVTHETHIPHRFTHSHAKVFSVVQCCGHSSQLQMHPPLIKPPSNWPCQGWPYVGTWTGFQLPKTSFKH